MGRNLLGRIPLCLPPNRNHSLPTRTRNRDGIPPTGRVSSFVDFNCMMNKMYSWQINNFMSFLHKQNNDIKIYTQVKRS